MKTLIDALYDKDNNRFIVNYLDDIGDKESTLIPSADIFSGVINNETDFNSAFQVQLDLLSRVKPKLQYIAYKATKFSITVKNNKLAPKMFDTSELSNVTIVPKTGGKTQKQISDNLQAFILTQKGVPLDSLLLEVDKRYIVINGELIKGNNYNTFNTAAGTILDDFEMLMIDLYNN